MTQLTTDNRSLDEMILYYEARIEALLERIRKLESENADIFEPSDDSQGGR